MDKTLETAVGSGRFEENLVGLLEGAGLIADAVGLFGERPSLLVYPFVGVVVSFAVGLGGLGGVYLGWTTIGLGSGWQLLGVWILGILVVTYLLIAFVNTFFVAALVHEVYDYHHGIDLSIVSGMRAAARNWWPLFLWATLNWTIGRLLKRTRNRRSRGSRLMGEAISTAWTAATFFVVPVILFEDARGRDMLQKSAGHFRESWEQILAAVVGLRLVGWAVGSVGGALGGAFYIGDVALIALPIVLFFGILGGLLTLSLQGVLKATVYEHLTAADHDVGNVVPSETPVDGVSDTPIADERHT